MRWHRWCARQGWHCAMILGFPWMSRLATLKRSEIPGIYSVVDRAFGMASGNGGGYFTNTSAFLCLF